MSEVAAVCVDACVTISVARSIAWVTFCGLLFFLGSFLSIVRRLYAFCMFFKITWLSVRECAGTIYTRRIESNW